MWKNRENNYKVLTMLSKFLNDTPTLIDTGAINKLTKYNISEERAYLLLLISYLGIEDNNPLVESYFNKMIKKLDNNEYMRDPYYQNIKFNRQKNKDWEIKTSVYKAYEAFVENDFKYDFDRVIPQLGFFSKPFYYPSIYQNNRLWMSVTPNEINTMKNPIKEAKGKVLTFGLGLGYYAYMVSLKEDVDQVIIIEKDINVIKLFKEYILPQFKNKEKIKIINVDAYEYLNSMQDNIYDYVFVDIYHDASDGKEVYLKFKPFEDKLVNTKFSYWIYDTIKYYL